MPAVLEIDDSRLDPLSVSGSEPLLEQLPVAGNRVVKLCCTHRHCLDRSNRWRKHMALSVTGHCWPVDN
jgi:hypothetical protein